MIKLRWPIGVTQIHLVLLLLNSCYTELKLRVTQLNFLVTHPNFLVIQLKFLVSQLIFFWTQLKFSGNSTRVFLSLKANFSNSNLLTTQVPL